MKFIPCNKPTKTYDPQVVQELMDELRGSILREKSPVQVALGLKELENPSLGPLEQDKGLAKYFDDLGGILCYDAKIVQDKVGRNFMTDSPMYRARIILLG
ncbi:MAG: hypothetical protein V1734_04350 [Nanoarchaeota archaeon]